MNPTPDDERQAADTPWRLPVLAAPDSPLIDRAIDFSRRHYDSCLFNHVIRSWLYAARIAHQRGVRVDDEVVAVAVLMHDLGLTRAFSGPDRFEVQSANAARAFALQYGLDDRRGQLIWDCVALHAIPSINAHKEPEVAICGAGVALDHEGFGLEQFPAEELRVILDAFPRLDLKRVLKTYFCNLAQTKPIRAHEGLVREFGSRFIRGYREASGADAILNAPFEGP